MPAEWNTVIASMRAYEGNHTIPRGEIYRQPEEDEVSEPEEFMNQPPVDSARLDHLRKQETLQLGNWKTDAEYNFKELCLRFDKPRELPDPKEK